MTDPTAHTILPAQDGDGSCDVADLCTNLGGERNFLEGSRIVLSGLFDAVTVVLGDAEQATAGICGESRFLAGDCRFLGSGHTLRCR
jgi:hypothetical protein